jgi:hypothetical protein
VLRRAARALEPEAVASNLKSNRFIRPNYNQALACQADTKLHGKPVLRVKECDRRADTTLRNGEHRPDAAAQITS